ncbi:unnamed protein product [Leptidea sinapis]|uniref:Uncharacterized protein n=1 Tax=Leptidea sinapis TaxID=189913 RepID=A0A5E4Q6K8_9NEOP|nr:unnamed protein product [Leptidea sinapis]
MSWLTNAVSVNSYYEFREFQHCPREKGGNARTALGDPSAGVGDGSVRSAARLFQFAPQKHEPSVLRVHASRPNASEKR